RVGVTVAGESVTIDGEHSIVRVVADSTSNDVRSITIEAAGTTTTFAIANDGDTVWLGNDGWSWPIDHISRERGLREQLAQRERELHPASPEVRSPMPGTVVTIPVSAGDEVAVGDTIVTVEAMKMEHRLTAPV